MSSCNLGGLIAHRELNGCSCVSDASRVELARDRLNGRKIDTLDTYRLVTDKNPMDNAVIVIFSVISHVKSLAGFRRTMQHPCQDNGKLVPDD